MFEIGIFRDLECFWAKCVPHSKKWDDLSFVNKILKLQMNESIRMEIWQCDCTLSCCYFSSFSIRHMSDSQNELLSTTRVFVSVFLEPIGIEMLCQPNHNNIFLVQSRKFVGGSCSTTKRPNFNEKQQVFVKQE